MTEWIYYDDPANPLFNGLHCIYLSFPTRLLVVHTLKSQKRACEKACALFTIGNAYPLHRTQRMGTSATHATLAKRSSGAN
jgi:hypothetical protein